MTFIWFQTIQLCTGHHYTRTWPKYSTFQGILFRRRYLILYEHFAFCFACFILAVNTYSCSASSISRIWIFFHVVLHKSIWHMFSCSISPMFPLIIHVEISWDVVGRLYTNTAEHTSCERSFSGGRWLPWRTYLQGKEIHWNLWIISLK